jgi:DnaJ-domain-containing protein 1
MSEPLTVWVRTEKGQVFGPLSPGTVELLIDNGALQGRLQVSLDGENYVFPGRVPGLRMVFPKELWGDVVVAGKEADAAWSTVALPPDASPSGIHQRPSGIAPGAVPSAPTAGPGARMASEHRPSAVAPRPPGASPSALVQLPVGLDDGLVLDASLDEAPLIDAVAEVAPVPASVAATESVEALAGQGPLNARQNGARLYFRGAAHQVSGCLAVTLSDRVLSVHFKRGSPELVESSHVDDAIGPFLLKAKLISSAQLAQAEADRGRFGADVLSALFGLGLLNPNAVLGHLSTRAKALLQKVLWAEGGSYVFTPGEVAPQRAFPLGNRWSLYCEVMRGMPAAESRRRLTTALNLPVMRGNGLVPVTDFKLTPQEARALQSFSGVFSLGQLLQTNPTEGEVSLRTAAMLYPADLVAFAAAPLAQAPSPPASQAPRPAQSAPVPPPASVPAPGAAASGLRNPAPATSVPPAAVPANAPPARPQASVSASAATTSSPSRAAPSSPSQARPSSAPSQVRPPLSSPSQPQVASPSTVSPSVELKQLLDVLEAMKKQNHFEVLGLDRKSEPGVVKPAYFKLARSYHPDTVAPGSPEAVAAAKADIFARIGEAYRVLSDAALRAEYVADLDAGGTGEKVDIAMILAGEEFFQKGQLLVKARKFVDALKFLDDAIAANGDEPEYYAWRGWARFFGYSDKKKGQLEVLPDIERCIKANPRAAAAHYFKGFILKTNGDTNGAKACFKKCVESDPNHIDAQRELRMMK